LNLNRLFPRLPISWKLAIAFVAMAGIPLAVVGLVGARSALQELERAALADLEHEMDLAATRTARAMREIGQHVSFLDAVGLGGALAEGGAVSVSAADLARTYLRADSSALFRIKTIDGSGYPVGVISRDGGILPLEPDVDPEPLYLWIAEGLPPDGLAFVPVELRRVTPMAGSEVVPAVAVIRPVFAGDSFVGAVVGEAGAADLFVGLDLAPPGLGGVTGLVDAEGRYLYHSEFKRHWASLLDGDALSLAGEFSPEVAERVLSGDSLIEAPGAVQIAVRRLQPGGSTPGTLTLYRTVPMSALYARVGRFLGVITLVGAALVVLVALLSVVAARQITRPILRLQHAAHILAAGGGPPPVAVKTNDELEDLAEDFNHMAATLSRHRDDLEALVLERTDALRRTQAQLTQLVTSSADAIVGTDPDDVVILWNNGAETLFGHPREEAVGVRLSDLIEMGDGGNTIERRFIDGALQDTGSVVNYRTRRRARDGTVLPVTLTKTVLRDEFGGTVGFSIIVRDDRARELLEDQMRRSERLAAVSVMAAGLAHELNNPLSVLGNRIELMQRDAVAQESGASFLRDLDVLRKHVGRIGSITGDLLRFARSDDGEMARVCVNDVIRRVDRLTHRVFVAADLDLVMQLDPGLPPAFGNENVIETVLVNLLLNAKHATPKGGRVEVATRAGASSTVEIEVRDTGPGVPPELRLRIFEPFFTTKAGDGGTGLGLAVCRALVDRMGGSLQVGPWPGGGASFVVRIPQDAYTAVSA
jgi:PAS domain S-box-containing protein